MSIEDLIVKERGRIRGFVGIGKEFSYLRIINKEDFGNVFILSVVYDYALDCYNYWKKEGVVNAKEESLVSTYRAMYGIYQEFYNKGGSKGGD
jgi:hypothetical protein